MNKPKVMCNVLNFLTAGSHSETDSCFLLSTNLHNLIVLFQLDIQFQMTDKILEGMC